MRIGKRAEVRSAAVLSRRSIAGEEKRSSGIAACRPQPGRGSRVRTSAIPRYCVDWNRRPIPRRPISWPARPGDDTNGRLKPARMQEASDFDTQLDPIRKTDRNGPDEPLLHHLTISYTGISSQVNAPSQNLGPSASSGRVRHSILRLARLSRWGLRRWRAPESSRESEISKNPLGRAHSQTHPIKASQERAHEPQRGEMI